MDYFPRVCHKGMGSGACIAHLLSQDAIHQVPKRPIGLHPLPRPLRASPHSHRISPQSLSDLSRGQVVRAPLT